MIKKNCKDEIHETNKKVVNIPKRQITIAKENKGD